MSYSSSTETTVAAFIQAAPPGELSNVVNDIKALATSRPDIVGSLDSAFKQYNEEQYTTVKVQGSSDAILITPYNSLGATSYFDTATQTSVDVDHATQTASTAQHHPLDSPNADLIRSLLKSFLSASAEHFPSYTVGVYPVDSNSTIALVLVANKYSPQNFWNGRWRSTYILDSSLHSLSGSVKADVHYYEDGNVRMSSKKSMEVSSVPANADGIVREIVKAENRFQEELNRSFVALAEGSFKSLRRQLPVTRQRVEWEKIGGYRLGQDIGGGRSK